MKGNEILIVGLVIVFLIGVSYFGSSISGNQPFEPRVPGGMQIRVAQCSDNIDNDLDGLIDYPSDPGCRGIGDNKEKNGCFEPVWFEQGDAFFGEDTENPNWVWMVSSIDAVQQTSINSPTDFSGPLIGVANTFGAENLNENVLRPVGGWDNIDKAANWNYWSYPYDYRKLMFVETTNYSYESPSFPRWPPATVTVSYLDSFDTTQAVNVPVSLQQYLKPDAKVVEVKGENQENVPIFSFTTQRVHTDTGFDIGVGDTVYDGSGQEVLSWWVSGNIDDVYGDGSVNVSIYNKSRIQGVMQPRDLLGNYIISSRTELPVLDGRYQVFNYLTSPDYGSASDWQTQWREWAILYVYEPASESRSLDTPTSRLYFQEAMVSGSQKFIPFYINYDTGELTYPHSLIGGSQGDVAYVWYDYFWSVYYVIGDNLRETGFLTVDFVSFLNWPGSSFGSGHLVTKFGIDSQTGELASLGSALGTAEPDEFVYHYSFYPSVLNLVQIGTKTGAHKTSYGIDVSNPAANSQQDKEVFYLPPNKDFALVTILYPIYHNGLSSSIEFGRNVFTNHPFRGLPWNLDYTLSNNYAKLLNGTISFGGNEVGFHEALVFGMSTPKTETSLTGQQDEYQDNVYVETKPAIIGDAYQNDGMKYVYAFDTPIDLIRLSDTTPLRIEFLGKILRFVGYKQEGGRDSLLVGIDRCAPSACGNEIIEEGEECDGANLNGTACTDLGFSGGILSCYSPGSANECMFNITLCIPHCGDGICQAQIESCTTCPEDCDVCSFVKGTFVSMADGGKKPIENVEVGDWVLSYDFNSEEIVSGEVSALNNHLASEYYFINNELRVTATNPILVNGEWKYPPEINIGDVLMGETGEGVIVDSLEKIVEQEEVYDLHIEETGTYFADGVLVHNKPPLCRDDADCDDGRICTADSCTPGGLCAYIEIPNCIEH